MSADMGVNGGQHIVSMADANPDSCSTATMAAEDEASLTRLLTTTNAVVVSDGNVADTKTDANASRKRSREHDRVAAGSKRNSKNRDSVSARVPRVHDFESLFEQIGADAGGGSCAAADGFEFAEISAVAVNGNDSDGDSDPELGFACAGQRQRQRGTVSTSPSPLPTNEPECSKVENTNRDNANANHRLRVNGNVNVDVDAELASTNGLLTSSKSNKFAEETTTNDDALVETETETNTDARIHPLVSSGTNRSERNSSTVPYTRTTPPNRSNVVAENWSSSTYVQRCKPSPIDDIANDLVRESKYTSTVEKKTTGKKKIVTQYRTNVAENAVAINTTAAATSNTAAAASVPPANNGIASKSKKSKKNKKYGDEKENISVTKSSLRSQRGDDGDDFNFHQILDDGDEFSNVCVRELRSGFGKFDQLTKKTLLHVRSQDSSKAQQHFNQNANGAVAENACSTCKACNKNVFAMEMIKAERAVWHRNCFRCDTCNKQLTVDIYSSHEGKLYCKPHFKDLFKPKVIVEDEKPVKLRKPELIIRENQPLELPPDVVRACDKPDLGLEELSSLNVKSRFQVFEKPNAADEDESIVDRSAVCVKRSPSILSKLARFQAKGMDVGVSSDILNGIDYEESTSSEEEDAADKEDNQQNNIESNGITKSVVSREKPIAFNKMNDVKKNWENGQTARNEERREERREELQRIRSRLFMGKQNKMKEAYENAVAESEKCSVKRDVEIKADKARLIKEKFEKGQVVHYEDSDEESSAKKQFSIKDDDMDVFEAGISKKSRSIFQEMDAAAAIKTRSKNVSPQSHTQIPAPATSTSNSTSTIRNGHKEKMMDRQLSNENVVRSSDPVDQVVVQTADISSKYKFFETYKPPEVQRKTFRITPPREGQLLQSNSPERDAAEHCEPQVEDESQLLKKSNTTAKMLSLFRQLEEAQQVLPDGPKPMKKFTPPPMSNEGSSDDEEYEDEDESTDDEDSESLRRRTDHGNDVIRACDKTEDEYLKLAQAAAKAKSLKEKFEKWQPEKQSNNNAVNLLDSEQASLDTTKSLRARFESFRSERPQDKPRPKVNRFVFYIIGKFAQTVKRLSGGDGHATPYQATTQQDTPPSSLSAGCDTCFKTVYQLEKVEAGDKIFHRSCFRCSRCNGVLRMETFTMNNGQLYCVPHFKQLFIVKGNYDEGFGKDQHKNKWPVKPDVVPTISNT